MPTEKFLNNLIVNKVDNSDTYKAMQTAGLVNEDEIYLIENPTANSIIEVNKNLEQKFWRGTKAEYDAITEKADDTMYIVTDESEINAATYMAMNIYDPQGKETDIFAYVEEHGGVQSDWDETDEASKAYVQNRPFGKMYGYGVDVELCYPKPTASTNYPGLYEYRLGTMYLEMSASKFKVLWNGQEYECLNPDYTGISVRFGNFSLIDSTLEDTEEPFLVYAYVDTDSGVADTIIYSTDNTEYPGLSIWHYGDYIKKLGHDYIEMTDDVEKYSYRPATGRAVREYVDNAIGAAISASY